MRRPIEKLLIKFLDYQRKKWYFVYKLFNKSISLPNFIITFYRLKRMLLREIRAGSNIIKSVERMLVRHNFEELEPLLKPLVKLNYELLYVLHKEYAFFKFNPFSLYYSPEVREAEVERFKELFNDELQLSRQFDTITEKHGNQLKLFKGFSQKRKEFERTKNLLRRSGVAFKKLLRASTIKEAALANQELLFLLNTLQKTEFYDYIKEDVDFIRKKAKYIMQNPKKHKIKYFLTGVYLVSPFTFEATGIILVLRYATKYSVKRVKKVIKKK